MPSYCHPGPRMPDPSSRRSKVEIVSKLQEGDKAWHLISLFILETRMGAPGTGYFEAFTGSSWTHSG